MGWSRFDDEYDSNPKMVTVGLAAQGLHARAVCYSRRHLTDGRVPSAWVVGQLASDPVLTAKQQRAVVGLLVEHNAFGAVDSGYLVHDFLDFQPSREHVESQRKEDRLRKDSGGNPNGKPPGSKRTPRGRAAQSQSQSPTTEEPNGSSSSKVTDEAATIGAIHSAGLCHLLADLMRERDPKAKVAPDSKAWRDAARLLVEKDERSPEDVERVIRWCQADSFWATNIESTVKLRAKFTQLWGKMQASGLHQAISKAPPMQVSGEEYAAKMAAKSKRESARVLASLSVEERAEFERGLAASRGAA